jgi:hypothetical protein
MRAQRFLSHFIWTAAGTILLAAGAGAALAQGISPARPVAVKPPAPSAFALPVAPASEATPAAGHSLLEQPAVPATIKVDGGRLSVSATNASLSQTLRDVSTALGTQIDGISKDQRIFGIYGPGSPQEVLTALLDDSGYNVLMVGRMAGGAPRQLVLSARSATSVAAPASAPSRASSEDDDDDTSAAPPPEPPPAPAASTPAAPDKPAQVKTPQQMLEELQQLHRGQDAPALPRDQPQ